MKAEFFTLFLSVFFLSSAEAHFSENRARLVCEGQDSREGFYFWYDISLSGIDAQSRFSSQRSGEDLEIGELLQSQISDEKFIVQSPYKDLKARLAFEQERWVLDLMEMNGDFVIPSYDFFECTSL